MDRKIDCAKCGQLNQTEDCPRCDGLPETITLPRERLRELLASAWWVGYTVHQDAEGDAEYADEYADRILAELEAEK